MTASLREVVKDQTNFHSLLMIVMMMMTSMMMTRITVMTMMTVMTMTVMMMNGEAVGQRPLKGPACCHW